MRRACRSTSRSAWRSAPIHHGSICGFISSLAPSYGKTATDRSLLLSKPALLARPLRTCICRALGLAIEPRASPVGSTPDAAFTYTWPLPAGGAFCARARNYCSTQRTSTRWNFWSRKAEFDAEPLFEQARPQQLDSETKQARMRSSGREPRMNPTTRRSISTVDPPVVEAEASEPSDAKPCPTSSRLGKRMTRSVDESAAFFEWGTSWSRRSLSRSSTRTSNRHRWMNRPLSSSGNSWSCRWKRPTSRPSRVVRRGFGLLGLRRAGRGCGTIVRRRGRRLLLGGLRRGTRGRSALAGIVRGAAVGRSRLFLFLALRGGAVRAVIAGRTTGRRAGLGLRRFCGNRRRSQNQSRARQCGQNFLP